MCGAGRGCALGQCSCDLGELPSSLNMCCRKSELLMQCKLYLSQEAMMRASCACLL